MILSWWYLSLAKRSFSSSWIVHRISEQVQSGIQVIFMFSAKMSHLNAYCGIRSVPEARYFDRYMYVDVHKQSDAW